MRSIAAMPRNRLNKFRSLLKQGVNPGLDDYRTLPVNPPNAVNSKLLRAGAKPNIVDGLGCTPLMPAAEQGSVDKCLLQDCIRLRNRRTTPRGRPSNRRLETGDLQTVGKRE